MTKLNFQISLALTFVFFVLQTPLVAQNESAFKEGEWFQFNMSYSGFLKAGEATLSVKEESYDGKPVYNVVGKGWTTGAIKFFFKVEDYYQSYIEKSSMLPLKFVRKINEGGYTKNKEIYFNHSKNEALVFNIKKNTKKNVETAPNIQDMISSFYYLRNQYDTDDIKIDETITINMFFDEDNFKFKLKLLKREVIKTKLGGKRVKIKTLKFRPYVQSGRVFKEKESLEIWVSDDKNKIPIKLKANLSVGSLRAELNNYKGLTHSLNIIYD